MARAADGSSTLNWLERKLVQAALRRFLKGRFMQKIIDFLSGKKTYLAAAVAILHGLSCLVGLQTGAPCVDHGTAISEILTALMVIFLRQGVSKSGPTSPPSA